MSAVAQSLVIRNARVFDPGENLDSTGDVLVTDGTIADCGPGLRAPQSTRELDASGLLLLPAFIDLCAHLGEPGEEYKEDIQSGLTAAAQGGFCSVCSLPNTNPVNDSAELTSWLCARASDHPVRLAPIAAATVGLRGADLTEMLALQQAGAVAVGSGSKSIASAAVMRRVLEYAADLDLPVFHHTEDAALSSGAEMNEGVVSAQLGLRGSPELAEQVVVERDLAIAQFTGARYHALRVSSPMGVKAVARARALGVHASCAVPVHNLALSEEDLRGYDPNRRLSPPLRSERERLELCRLLQEGQIDAVVSNHRAQAVSDKECDFGSARTGSVALDSCWSLLFQLVQQGALSLSAAVTALTAGPARVLNVPRPRIAPGESANLTLIAPNASWTVNAQSIASKSKNSAVLGRKLPGPVQLTIATGRIAFERKPEPNDYVQ